MMAVIDMHMVDLDVGEIFYSSRLFQFLFRYCVVDLGPYLQSGKDASGFLYWLFWVCTMMGFIMLTYMKIQ